LSAESLRYVFGPVWSRRLGRSLGIDLVPFKTCTYDCLYCQLGRTTCKTAARLEYVPVDAVLDEVERRLASGPPPDYLTLSGSGEPTLHSRVGELISGLRRLSDRPIAVLTNGSLLWSPEVHRSLLEADLILPSLDAGEEALFRCVNRPLPGLSLERVVQGLATFSREYTGQIWLEVLLLGGATAMPEQVDHIAYLAARIKPARIQVNTVARPPADASALPVPIETLRCLAGRFPGHVDVLVDVPGEQPAGMPTDSHAHSDDEILSLIERRPGTLDDIARGLSWPHGEVVKRLHRLSRTGEIVSLRVREAVFFRPTAPSVAAEAPAGGRHVKGR
jgi:wyosine [tRNA(Phe)-imidazoG37] synthetase (radical SAM superfamily)